MSIEGHDSYEGDDHCQDCAFWDHEAEKPRDDYEQALCLRFPPSVLLMTDDDGTVLQVPTYPKTEATWWCGEFKKRA